MNLESKHNVDFMTDKELIRLMAKYDYYDFKRIFNADENLIAERFYHILIKSPDLLSEYLNLHFNKDDSIEAIIQILISQYYVPPKVYIDNFINNPRLNSITVQNLSYALGKHVAPKSAYKLTSSILKIVIDTLNLNCLNDYNRFICTKSTAQSVYDNYLCGLLRNSSVNLNVIIRFIASFLKNDPKMDAGEVTPDTIWTLILDNESFKDDNISSKNVIINALFYANTPLINKRIFFKIIKNNFNILTYRETTNALEFINDMDPFTYEDLVYLINSKQINPHYKYIINEYMMIKLTPSNDDDKINISTLSDYELNSLTTLIKLQNYKTALN